jgi:hypothetical protein
LVDRVELRPDGIQLAINLPTESLEKLVGCAPAPIKLTRLIPMQMRRRGVEMKFVIDGNVQISPRTDPALLKMIARAHR